MAILNVTPDSFSDGGAMPSIDDALRRAEQLIADGADILDIGGESTRPGSGRVAAKDEIERVVPVISAIAKRFDTPISVDTSKSQVARAAIDAGAEIINDISGLRFDALLAPVAAESNAGLVLMHSRGTFETMHSEGAVDDIFADVCIDFRRALTIAKASGVAAENIVLDIGIGFGKTFEQNLELIARLDRLVAEFVDYPMLVGVSRKSFIGKLLGGAAVDQRLYGSLAASAIALWNGANILRTHDAKATRELAVTVASLID